MGTWVDKRTVASRRDRGRVCRPVVCSIDHSMAGNLTCPRCGFKCPHRGALLNHMKGPDGCQCRRFRVVFDEMKAKHEIDMIDSEGLCLLSGWDHFNLDDFNLWCKYTKRCWPERLSLQDADTPYKPSFQRFYSHTLHLCKMTGM